ncbi:MAG: hypothetical protein ABIH23_16890 [bacterium]
MRSHANPALGNRPTQKAAVLAVLERAGGDYVSVLEIRAAQGPNTCILSHTRIISYVRADLRERNMGIECKEEWIDGQMQTKYRLVMPNGQLRIL